MIGRTKPEVRMLQNQKENLELVSQAKHHFNFFCVVLTVFSSNVTVKADLLVQVRFETKTVVTAGALQFVFELKLLS